MIVWSGWGIVVGVFGLGCGVAMELAIETATQDPDYYQAHGWPKFMAMTMAGSLQRVVNLLVYDGGDEDRGVFGEHSFFFISMRHWPAIFLAIGILTLFVR